MIDYSPRVVSTSCAPSSVHPSVRATSARARDLCTRTYPPARPSRRVASSRVASRRASPRESSSSSRVSADAWMGVAPLPRLSRSRSRPPSRARFHPRELRLDASRSRVDLDDLARASNERLARRRRRPAAVWGKTFARVEGTGTEGTRGRVMTGGGGALTFRPVNLTKDVVTVDDIFGVW